jgi:hypothetical protein
LCEKSEYEFSGLLAEVALGKHVEDRVEDSPVQLHV